MIERENSRPKIEERRGEKKSRGKGSENRLLIEDASHVVFFCPRNLMAAAVTSTAHTNTLLHFL